MKTKTLKACFCVVSLVAVLFVAGCYSRPDASKSGTPLAASLSK
jgi:hypothetical protein